jgi:nitric oxide reductase NorQ protein
MNREHAMPLAAKSGASSPSVPYYAPAGDECRVFEAAWRNRLPLLLKGPTGCGKTRFVTHMAARLCLPLFTVACHDDLTSADLTGRYLLKGGETVWCDGPLTSAVRAGGICYLDEIVEARKDVTVVLHPLTDDRRTLLLDRTGETLQAPPSFMLVASYNPGYQNVLKSLKPSTRQRFLGLDFSFPREEREAVIVSAESGIAIERARLLVRVAAGLRALRGRDVEEAASTRLLVYTATLMADGMGMERAIELAMLQPLSDDAAVLQGLRDLVSTTLG